MHIARDEHSVHTDQPGPGAVENAADRGVAKSETVGSGTRARLDAAFARQGQRGLMLAAAARSVAVCVIICWYVVANPKRGLAFAWVIGSAGFFLVTGSLPLRGRGSWLIRRLSRRRNSQTWTMFGCPRTIAARPYSPGASASLGLI
jgi:hypothetical protein